MATNFPNTSINNPATGAPWVNGDSYPDPETGLTYYWYLPVWKTAISPTGATDDKYVEVLGDNMTGNLTLGTDKITLDATAGSASFVDIVSVGSTLKVINKSTQAESKLAIIGNVNNTTNYGKYVFTPQKFWIGPDVNDASQATIEFDVNVGTASFAGDVTATLNEFDVTNQASLGVNMAPGGLVQVKRSSASSSVKLLQGFGGTDETVTINSDGSASFAKNVTTSIFNNNSDSGKGVLLESGGLLMVQRSVSSGDISIAKFYQGKTATVDINANGSASFKGRVYSTRTAGTSCFQVYSTGDAQAKIDLNSNGSATFQGTVTAIVVPPSDARFKENITPAKPQLADVVALGGLLKNYDWNDQAPLNEEIRSQRQLGLIAQEAETVCPAIVKDIHRTKTVEVEAAVKGPRGTVIKEAVTKEEDDSYKGISQDALIMKLIGAVTELSAEVEALKAVKTTKK